MLFFPPCIYVSTDGTDGKGASSAKVAIHHDAVNRSLIIGGALVAGVGFLRLDLQPASITAHRYIKRYLTPPEVNRFLRLIRRYSALTLHTYLPPRMHGSSSLLSVRLLEIYASSNGKYRWSVLAEAVVSVNCRNLGWSLCRNFVVATCLYILGQKDTYSIFPYVRYLRHIHIFLYVVQQRECLDYYPWAWMYAWYVECHCRDTQFLRNTKTKM